MAWPFEEIPVSQPRVLARCMGREVVADCGGGDITTFAGVQLVSMVDAMIGLTRRVGDRLAALDTRQPGKVRYGLPTLVRQRVFGLAVGEEDVVDQDGLRHDLAFQTACGRDAPLGSASTVGRMENRADRDWARIIAEELVETFIASFPRPPKRIELDVDATDDAVHGNQVGRFFHGYYDKYCFLPLYVTCGDHLLAAYLRPANRGAAHNAGAVLALLIRRLRQAWPKVRIMVRGDGDFSKPRMLTWFESRRVDYILGYSKNSAIVKLNERLARRAEAKHGKSGEKERVIGAFKHKPGKWKKKRRFIARFDHGEDGSDPRFVVTNMKGRPRHLYEDVYCARGDMENRIKEMQYDLFADRTSCHEWWPNQFRLLLSAMAYTLVVAIRRLALKGTGMARALAGTIQKKLLRVGAVVVRNTRRIYLHLSSAYPDKDLFFLAAERLAPT